MAAYFQAATYKLELEFLALTSVAQWIHFVTCDRRHTCGHMDRHMFSITLKAFILRMYKN